MAHDSNGNIKKGQPISLHDDVYPVLGISAVGGYYDLGAACRGPVNMWSRYKPVRYNKLGELTEAEFKSVSYGLRIPANAKTSTPTDSKWQLSLWDYDRPDGATYPFRLTDFNGYFHNETAPCGHADTLAFTAAVTSHMVSFASKAISGVDHISPTEIDILKDVYPCIVLFGGGITGWMYKTSDKTFAGGGTTVTLNASDLPTALQAGAQKKEWSYIMCGCTGKKVNMGDANSAHQFVSLPVEGSPVGTVTYSTTVSDAFSFSFTHVTPNYVTASGNILGLQLKQFQMADAVNPHNNQYLCPAAGGFTLIGTIKNPNSSAQTFNPTSVTFNATKNLVSGVTSTPKVYITCLTSTDGRAFTLRGGSFAVPANSSMTVAFAVPRLWDVNSSGSTVSSAAVYGECVFQLYLNGYKGIGLTMRVTRSSDIDYPVNGQIKL